MSEKDRKNVNYVSISGDYIRQSGNFNNGVDKSRKVSNQYSSGDVVMGNKVSNQVSNSNIGNIVNEAKDNVQVTASGFTQTAGTSTAELLEIIAHLRQISAQFPPEVQEDIVIDIDDIEDEIKKPANQRNWPKIKKRLTALATTASLIASGVAAANKFTEDVIELGNKVGIELQLPSSP
ncbi:MAG: hypothetical protein ACFE0I_01060 [Elainellaceae cyanobacterium]